MASFQIKSDLPKNTQDELDRISAIDSGLRLASETNFLTSLAQYLTNEIIDKDANGLIIRAAGNTLPTGLTGFKKGAIFIDKDATGNGLYQNTGDENSATWELVNNNNEITSGTPVNAVAATRVLTVGGLPTDNNTVTIDGVVYTFQSAISTAAAAVGTLSTTGNAQNTEEVVIGNKTYTFKTALTEVKANSTLTTSSNFADAETVTIDGVMYKFTVNLSTPAVVNEIKIGATVADSVDNLVAAITHAAGEGSTYSTGTVVHPTVTAVRATNNMTVTAKSVGVAGNSIATTETCASASFTGGTLGNGVDAVANEVKVGTNAEGSIDNLVAAITHAAGEGTNYSTGTVAHTQVTAVKATAATMTVTASATGDAGNAIATTTTMANASFGGTTLAGGEGAQAAHDVLIGVSAEACIDNLVSAITADTGEGTTYGTGTTAHSTVTAAKASASTMTVTAKTKGTAANSIALAKSGTNLTWAGNNMTGGVDGTVANARTLFADASYLYICTAANTVSTQNWRRVSLGSAY